jgi:hypothetical protein
VRRLQRDLARRDKPAVGRFWRAFAFIVVGLRYPLLIAWIGTAAAATLLLPPMESSGSIGNAVPKGSPGLRAEIDSARLFGLPLASQVQVVQRNPHRFSVKDQLRAARGSGRRRGAGRCARQWPRRRHGPRAP